MIGKLKADKVGRVGGWKITNTRGDLLATVYEEKLARLIVKLPEILEHLVDVGTTLTSLMGLSLTLSNVADNLAFMTKDHNNLVRKVAENLADSEVTIRQSYPGQSS